MDNLTIEQRHRNMQRIRAKDTGIEVRLRKALWHEGIRYRKNYKVLPGKPDIAITKYKIAIFCDSSFFHGRDYDIKKKPATNADYWKQKIERNIKRDHENERELRGLGWTAIRFWDTDINQYLDECVEAVKEAIAEKVIEEINIE